MPWDLSGGQRQSMRRPIPYDGQQSFLGVGNRQTPVQSQIDPLGQYLMTAGALGGSRQNSTLTTGATLPDADQPGADLTNPPPNSTGHSPSYQIPFSLMEPALRGIGYRGFTETPGFGTDEPKYDKTFNYWARADRGDPATWDDRPSFEFIPDASGGLGITDWDKSTTTRLQEWQRFLEVFRDRLPQSVIDAIAGFQ